MSKGFAVGCTVGGIIGGIAGGFVGWWVTREKETKRADLEIESVQAFYQKLNNDKANKEKLTAKQEYTSSDEAAMANREKPSLSSIPARTSPKDDVKYSSYFNTSAESENPSNAGSEHPYLIDYKEFGEFEDYSRISLLYFKDGFVAEEDGSVIDDLFNTLGIEFKTKLETENLDEIYIRNDRLKADYEILRDLRYYEDYIKTIPKKVDIK